MLGNLELNEDNDVSEKSGGDWSQVRPTESKKSVTIEPFERAKGFHYSVEIASICR